VHNYKERGNVNTRAIASKPNRTKRRCTLFFLSQGNRVFLPMCVRPAWQSEIIREIQISVR